MINDMAFSCFAQATEGDFTVGQEKLNTVAEILAHNLVYSRVQPDTMAISYVCQTQGFNYNDLLSEEISYLKNRIKEEIKQLC